MDNLVLVKMFATSNGLSSSEVDELLESEYPREVDYYGDGSRKSWVFWIPYCLKENWKDLEPLNKVIVYLVAKHAVSRYDD